MRFLAHHYTRYLGDLSGGQAIAALVARHYARHREQLGFYRFDAHRQHRAVQARATANGMNALAFSAEQSIDALVREVDAAFTFNGCALRRAARTKQCYHAAALDGISSATFSRQRGVDVLFYLVVWGLVFAGTALFLGVFIPFVTGDSLLFGAGLVAASTSSLEHLVLAIGTGIAAFLGDQVGFLLGRRYGRGYLDRRGGRRTQAAIVKTESFYRKFGWWSVVIARFMPWGRVFVPVIAGVGRMNYYKFLTAQPRRRARLGRRHHPDRVLRGVDPRREERRLRHRRLLHHRVDHLRLPRLARDRRETRAEPRRTRAAAHVRGLAHGHQASRRLRVSL